MVITVMVITVMVITVMAVTVDTAVMVDTISFNHNYLITL
jgi:hypothetical protein